MDCSGFVFNFAKIAQAHFRKTSIFSAALSLKIHALSSLKTTSNDQ
jgi:hypothetical protein